MLYIDPRAGSDKLLVAFEGSCESQRLEAGDVAFFGNGPKGDVWYIGIEYKQLDDIVACIKSRRFVGSQLPAMMRIYDLCFLLIEGIPRPDRDTGQLVRYRGKSAYGMGIRYSAFDNFLTSVNMFSSLAGKPCIVKMASTAFDTVQMISNMHNLFQKSWEEHVSINQPDLTKVQRVSYELEIVKVRPSDPEYPKYLLRKMLFQIERMGWAEAGVVADRFGTMKNAMMASQKEWESIERIGKTMAKRVYESLHGCSDDTIVRRTRSKSGTAKL